jgi:hypothetical protein
MQHDALQQGRRGAREPFHLPGNQFGTEQVQLHTGAAAFVQGAEFLIEDGDAGEQINQCADGLGVDLGQFVGQRVALLTQFVELLLPFLQSLGFRHLGVTALEAGQERVQPPGHQRGVL